MLDANKTLKWSVNMCFCGYSFLGIGVFAVLLCGQSFNFNNFVKKKKTKVNIVCIDRFCCFVEVIVLRVFVLIFNSYLSHC